MSPHELAVHVATAIAERQPRVVAIVGPPATGKSSLCERLSAASGGAYTSLAEESWLVPRQRRLEERMSGLTESAFNLKEMSECLAALREGRESRVAHYDHRRGETAWSVSVTAASTYLLDGSMWLHPMVKSQPDVIVLLLPSSPWSWRSSMQTRDRVIRGYSREDAHRNCRLYVRDWRHVQSRTRCAHLRITVIYDGIEPRYEVAK